MTDTTPQTPSVPAEVLHALDAAMTRKPVGRKEDQLLDAAEEIFLSHGYAGASVDDIVLKAGISKATLYKYFHEKEALFRAVIDRRCVEQRARLRAVTFNASTEDALIEGCKLAVTFMVSPLAQAVYRTCVAEAQRLPHVGHAFYIAAIMPMVEHLTAIFERSEEAGDLIIPDKHFAAHQFWQLARSVYFYELMFQVRDTVSQNHRNRVVKETLETFIARYGTESFKPRMAAALAKLD
ncbi:MAG: TetR/AcrR family transcriptional regulator [Rhizobiales bacterium]|nr:TetR/AcrR family transcriptional regulator [Hyphomicrobiales bacterium]MBO6697409.1 TetR/AcrR family transcriptional regulator [Hyphomicrobiales bacterium]MBO6736336.1 TetR/AcrR family transcriptional regulator [Hyphomicrobiales bacterium]MBO6912806.1 TetR/AcrR family transcriptional regulator [Hyphomicrobiales bacterium]MBO6953974.1 TetR/AcrR family transcriptional regulator [Hyphomicrobiales bacterium]